MSTIKKTIETADNYYTGVLYGPVNISTNTNSNYENKQLSEKNLLTFQFNIYKNDSYLLFDNSSFQTQITQYFFGGYDLQYTEIFDIIPITDGFMFIEAIRDLESCGINLNLKKF